MHSRLVVPFATRGTVVTPISRCGRRAGPALVLDPVPAGGRAGVARDVLPLRPGAVHWAGAGGAGRLLGAAPVAGDAAGAGGGVVADTSPDVKMSFNFFLIFFLN